MAKPNRPKVTDEVRRAKLKTSAVLRAQFNLKTALDRVDFAFDVVKPALAEVELGATKGELPQFVIEDDSKKDN